MTAGAAPRLARRLAVLVAVPLAVWLIAVVGAWWTTPRGDSVESRLRTAAEPVRARFDLLLTESSRIVGIARSGLPTDALRYAVRGVWHERVEGVGLVATDGTLVDWEGTPAGPGPASVDRERFAVSAEGLRVRLTVSSAPDATGRSAVAVLLLDSALDDFAIADLLDGSVPRGFVLDVELLDSSSSHADLAEFFGGGDGVYRATETPTLYFPLRSPDGAALALATLYEQPPAIRAQRARAAGLGAAAVVFAALLLSLFEWTSLCRSPVGLALALGSIAAGRGVLLWTRAPANLLPRELGSPSLYGSSQMLALLGSPADLLLTAISMLLVSYAVRELCRALAPRRRIAALTISGALASVWTTATFGLSISLARHGSLSAQLFERMDQPLGQALLLIALAVALIATAEIGGVGATLLTRPRETLSAAGWPSRLIVGLVLLPLAAMSSAAFLRTMDRIDLERLRSEYAPRVLEQTARREIALRASITGAAASPLARDVALGPERAADAYAAYHLWVESELFHLGFKSSIDIYDAGGRLVSHFGFDLPPLEEDVILPVSAEPVRDEIVYPVPQRVLHAGAPIVRDGVVHGAVVGHVLDEPENLPFLPSNESYLAALGPGARPGPGRKPDYVLYGPDDRVLLSTLHQPPAAQAQLSGTEGQTRVRVRAGRQDYRGVTLSDGLRTHLLVLPVRPLLDRMAVFAKLLLIVVGIFAALTLLQTAVRDGGFAFVVRGVRESFYHKLLATLLAASLLPLFVLALFLGGYFEGRASEQLSDSAAQVVSVVRRVVEDYAAVQSPDDEGDDRAELGLDDEILYWLRGIVDQEIHLYRDGLLEASSKRELFTSGLLTPRLPGSVHRRLARQGLPYVVLPMRLGPTVIPVAYARVNAPAYGDGLIAAVPLTLAQREIEHAAERVEEMLVLTTVLLAVLVIVATSLVAGNVARPVRELVSAAGRIADGDYSARLETRSADEVARLVQEFNAMAEALAAQRADLERRRDYVQALLTNATTGVLSMNAAGTIVTVNPAAEKLLTVGQPPPGIGDDLIESVSRNPGLEPLAGLLQEPARTGEPREIDLEIEGETRRLSCVRVELPHPHGDAPGVLVLLDDVTDLMRSNQLEAWAEMAQAIAHEIKNPLTPIQLSTEHLERLLRDRGALPSREIEACLDNVIKQVHALREIASEFSTYAKLPSLTPEPTDPVELMRDVLSPYVSAAPQGIEVEQHFGPAPVVQVDRRVLSRAIVNLIENALQAMPDGGTLTVGTSADAAGAVLFVGDTGPGLAREVRARLFEPYFSTKSSGTGLGLAIVRRAVEAHGGRIDIDSEAGSGTSFRITIPAGKPSPTVYSAHGGETQQQTS